MMMMMMMMMVMMMMMMMMMMMVMMMMMMIMMMVMMMVMVMMILIKSTRHEGGGNVVTVTLMDGSGARAPSSGGMPHCTHGIYRPFTINPSAAVAHLRSGTTWGGNDAAEDAARVQAFSLIEFEESSKL
ncbi:hypothetical protein EYF80_063387 [Liparis tanakae]|uniref:Uncharacterized protein n=1 Tax=Liparis tanakae TaxID=230148 RepID=A0A4Z2ECA0_9TELE|nr:hypothetical protein EYF80_063387 [Liparis tanakae]